MRRRQAVRWAVATTAAAVILGCGLRIGMTGTGHLDATLSVWSRISVATGGLAVTSMAPADIPDLIQRIFAEGVKPGDAVDLVFVVDTTGSMGDDIGAVKGRMTEILARLSASNPDRQVGLVEYRDRGDPFVSRTVLALTGDDGAITAAIGGLSVDGGGDLREHVYAGIDTALREQPWRAEASRHIVLMGDAPPHDDYLDDPRNYDAVIGAAAAGGTRIHTIGIQCDLLCQALIAVGL